MEKEIVNIIGPVNEKTFLSVGSKVLELTKTPEKEVIVVISSNGGSVTMGLGIYDLLKILPNPKEVLICGSCISIATIIALVAPVEKRYMTKNSIFAIHSSSVSGDHMSFDYSHLNTELSFMNGNHARLKKIYLSETKLSEKKIDKALFYDSLTIFSYEKCLKKVIVGKVLESTCDIF